jgi:hypothetical protein
MKYGQNPLARPVLASECARTPALTNVLDVLEIVNTIGQHKFAALNVPILKILARWYILRIALLLSSCTHEASSKRLTFTYNT